jgi:hypothetical protein
MDKLSSESEPVFLESKMATLIYPKTVNTASLLAVAGALIMPEAAYALVLELSHLVLELAHYLIRIFESALHPLVEHIFHTEARQTQIIVFSISLAMGLGAIYYLYRSLRWFFCRLIQNLQATLASYKSRYSAYWDESPANKFKLVAGFNAVLTFVYLISF